MKKKKEEETQKSVKKKKKRETVMTYSIEQLSVLHKVGMSAEEVWTLGAKRSFVL